MVIRSDTKGLKLVTDIQNNELTGCEASFNIVGHVPKSTLFTCVKLFKING